MAGVSFCPGCGVPRGELARFCASCGVAFTASDPVPHVAAPSAGRSDSPQGGAQKRPERRVWSLLVGTLIVVVFFAVAAWLAAPASTPLAVPTGTPLAGQGSIGADSLVTVTYRVDGAATGADLTYTDGSGNIQQQTGVAVPVVRSSDGGHGLRIRAPHGAFVSLSAQNTGDSGYLHCSIEADGVVINQGDASGGYAIVTCSATVP